MQTATIRPLAGGGIEILSPYHADFVASLKATVPSRWRKWVPEKKSWQVRAEYASKAMEIVYDYFLIDDLRHARSDNRYQDSQSYSSRGVNHFADLHLLPTAPQELVKAAYHCLALRHHPDHGGDHEQMVRINRAYRELTK